MMLNRVKPWLLSHELVIWLGVIIFSVLYSQDNIGGNSYLIPFNITVWTSVTCFILYSLGKIVFNQKIYVSQWAFWFYILLASIFFVGLVKTKLPNDQLIILLASFSVVFLFVLSLYQYRITQRNINLILLLICTVGFIEVLVSLVQMYDSKLIIHSVISYVPLKLHGRPQGTFQHVNLLAIFLALTVVASFYIYSSAATRQGSVFKRIYLIVLAFMAMYVLSLIGSRGGLLAIVLGLFAILFAKRKLWSSSAVYLSYWLISITLGYALSFMIYPDTSSWGSVSDKMSTMLAGSDVRFFLYSSAVQMFLESPLYGYGLGNYNVQLMNFIAVNGVNESVIDFDFSVFHHPHNELLYWVVQSGGIVLLVALLLVFLYFKKVAYFRSSVGLSLFALALPLVVSSMVSLPFILSGLHLFLFLLIVFIGIRHDKKSYAFSLVKGVKYIVLVFILGVSLNVTYFGWHTLKSSYEFFKFDFRAELARGQPYSDLLKVTYLDHASFNFFYQERSVEIMNALGTEAIVNRNSYLLGRYVIWVMNQPVSERNYLKLMKVVKVHLELNEIKFAKNLYRILLVKYKGFDLKKYEFLLQS